MMSVTLLAAIAQPQEITIRLPEAPSVVRWVEGGKKLIMVSSGSLREWPSGRTMLIPYEVSGDYGTSDVKDAIFNVDKTLLAYPIDGRRAVVVDLKRWKFSTVQTFSYQIAFNGRELVSLDYVGKDEWAVLRSKAGEEWLPKGHFVEGIDPLCRFAVATTGTYNKTQIVAYKRDTKGKWSKFAQSGSLPGEYVSGNWYDFHEHTKTIAFTSFWDSGATMAAVGVMHPSWQGKVIAKRGYTIYEAVQPPRWVGDGLLVPLFSFKYRGDSIPYDLRDRVCLYDLKGNLKQVLYEASQVLKSECRLCSADYDPKNGRIALSIGSDASGTVTIRKV